MRGTAGLSFIELDEQRQEIMSHWTPDRSGTWSEQNARGRNYAAELAEYLASTNDFSVLQKVIREIPQTTPVQGVEVGFFAGIAAAMASTVWAL